MVSKTLLLALSVALFAIDAYGYKKFVAYKQTMNYFTAWQTCRLYGGHLASIESAGENARVVTAIQAAGSIGNAWFIGATDIGIEGQFVWIGLNKKITSSSYTNWNTGEPNNQDNEDCVVIGYNAGVSWNDVKCNYSVEGFVLPTSFGLTYTVHNTKVTFFEAWNACISYSGYLASPESVRQNEAIWTLIKKTGATGGWWLSGTDIGMEGSWIWLSRNVPVGSAYGYDNFAAGEPNNVVTATNTENCLNIGFFGNSKWNDAACDSSFYYVCEY
uniref:C-type lectin domain-containing protein n=1 Tax=Anopheles dirus TaxID=7168 RepID=A0A182NPC3_9DIPT